MAEDHVREGAPTKPKNGDFFSWLPWEKMLIWGLFILAVYVLRHFFFTIFMTFMISYIMINVVGRATRILSPHTERVWLQRAVTLIGFIVLIAFLSGSGFVIYNPLKDQATRLYNRISMLNVESTFNDFLRQTVGAWRFKFHYREKSEEEYKKDLQEYKDRHFSTQAFEEFRRHVEDFDRAFQAQVIREEGERKLKDLRERERENIDLITWMSESPEVEKRFLEVKEDLIRDWKKDEESWILRKFGAARSPAEVRELQEYKTERDKELKYRFIEKELEKDRPKHIDQFKEHLGNDEYRRLGAAPNLLDERRRKFYESWKPSVGTVRYPFERFQDLRNATKAEFETALSGGESQDKLDKKVVDDFRRWKEDQLTQEALEGELRSMRLENIKTWLKEQMPDVVNRIAGIGLNIVNLLIQFGFSLLLSFFIVFDGIKLRRAFRNLEESPVRDFYREIAPGLMGFGRLIGRAFQAQGVIAICNTLLTFTAIKTLMIQNEVFLSAIVFICSFIPILGVVISSVPIAIMAIIQPAGSGMIHDGFLLALAAIGAVLVVHFIETSILNPMILGDMLHLHPVMVLGILAVGEYFFGVWGLLLGVPVSVYIFRCVLLKEEIDFSGKKPPPGGKLPAQSSPATPAA